MLDFELLERKLPSPAQLNAICALAERYRPKFEAMRAHAERYRRQVEAMRALASRTLPDPTVQRTLSIGYQCEHDGRIASLPPGTTGRAPPQRPSRTARKPAASKEEAVGHQQTPVAGGDAERIAEFGRTVLANNRQASRRAVDSRQQLTRERDAKLKGPAQAYRDRHPDASFSEIARRLALADSRSSDTIRKKLPAFGIK